MIPYHHTLHLLHYFYIIMARKCICLFCMHFLDMIYFLLCEIQCKSVTWLCFKWCTKCFENTKTRPVANILAYTVSCFVIFPCPNLFQPWFIYIKVRENSLYLLFDFFTLGWHNKCQSRAKCFRVFERWDGEIVMTSIIVINKSIILGPRKWFAK